VFGTRVAENHLGQRSSTAPTGRTYGCKRSDQTIKKLLRHGGLPGTTWGEFSDSIVKQQIDMRPHSRGAMRPSFASVPPSSNKRAQGKPGARCTRGLVCKTAQKNAHEHTGSAEASGFPCAVGYGLFRALPGEPCSFATVAPEKLVSQELGASFGRQDHTASPSASARVRLSQASRPPHPTARFVTIASRPSHRVRRAES
jgi:hypothetical protein